MPEEEHEETQKEEVESYEYANKKSDDPFYWTQKIEEQTRWDGGYSVKTLD